MPQLRNVRTATYTNQDICSFALRRRLHRALQSHPARQPDGQADSPAAATTPPTTPCSARHHRLSSSAHHHRQRPGHQYAVIFEFRDIIAEPGQLYRFYIQGLAGDTTTPDTALRIFEEMSHDILDWGVVTAATGTRITASGLGCVIDDTYNGRLIKFVEPNSGYCETTYITDYDATAGTSGNANIDIAAT